MKMIKSWKILMVAKFKNSKIFAGQGCGRARKCIVLLFFPVPTLLVEGLLTCQVYHQHSIPLNQSICGVWKVHY